MRESNHSWSLWDRLAWWSLGLAVGLIAWSHAEYYDGWSLDDPYISYRYAENLARGHGLVFNVGERVEGYSNFTYTLILAAAAKAGLDLPAFAGAFGLVCALACVWGVWRMLVTLAQGAQGEKGRIHWTDGALGLITLALSGPLAFWAVGGLETPFYAGLSLLGLWAAARETEGRGGLLLGSAGWLALTAMSRPEGVLCFGVVLIGKVLLLAVGRSRESRGRLITRIAAFCLLWGMVLVWRRWYYGDWLPNTYYAKATHPLTERLMTGGRYLWSAGWLWGSALVVFAVGATAATWRRAPALVILSAGYGGATAWFALWAGGDWMPMGRFIAPAVPMTAIVVAWGGSVWRESAKAWGMGAGPRWGVLIVLVLGSWAGMAAQERVEARPIMALYRAGALHQQYIEVGRWLKRYQQDHSSADGNNLLAAGEAGIVPYYSGLPFLDLGGLIDRHIARQPGALHYKVDVDYVFDRSPRFVFMQCRSLDPLRAYYDGGMDAALLADPRFRRQYRILKKWTRGAPAVDANPMVLFERRLRKPGETGKDPS